MTNFDPNFQVVSLDQTPAGALVIFDGVPAFVGINPAAGPRGNILAQYESSSGQFIFRYTDAVPGPRVLVPDQAMVVIRPKLDSFTLDVNLAPPSSQLFIDQGERFIVVNIPTGNQYRLLSLNSGILASASTSQKDAFTSWEVGVESLGEFVSVLKI
jgi:hypothetical protein